MLERLLGLLFKQKPYQTTITLEQREHLASNPFLKGADFHGMVCDLSYRYGEELGLWLAKRVAAGIRKCGKPPCLSHFRIADKARWLEVREYNAIRASGCCGSYDQEVTHYKSGRTFMFGFNYGH